jgi:chorismate dehydratase
VSHQLRISAIRFLNPAPLMWDFEHSPENERLGGRYRIHYSMPSRCAAELAAGEADIGLIPIAGYTPGLAVLPGCTIASLQHVRSILLVVRQDRPLDEIRRVAADTASRTSNAYAQIIFQRFYNNRPEFVPHAPNLDAMLADCDAAVLIGDPALLALENAEAREQQTSERLRYIDLAEEWIAHTGVPWVSAFWAVRPQAVAASGLTTGGVIEDFLQSRDHGLAHVNDLIEEWAPRIAVPAETIRTYLSKNIHYVLDEACLAGIETFYRYAAETGVLTEAPTIAMLR